MKVTMVYLIYVQVIEVTTVVIQVVRIVVQKIIVKSFHHLKHILVFVIQVMKVPYVEIILESVQAHVPLPTGQLPTVPLVLVVRLPAHQALACFAWGLTTTVVHTV